MKFRLANSTICTDEIFMTSQWRSKWVDSGIAKVLRTQGHKKI